MGVAQADLNRAHAATAEAESQVLTAEKNLAYQKERLDYTRIVSPYDGLIVRRDRDPGGVVVPEDRCCNSFPPTNSGFPPG